MSVLTALYRTYCSALDNDMVDRTEQLQQKTVLLPVYHSNRKSAGTNDMIEVTLSEKGEFIKAEWIPKDQIVIFPVTESSIMRTVGIAPHPLCDELSYLSQELDPEKHKAYESVRGEWVSHMEEGHPNRLLKILDSYLSKGTIFRDCVSSLFAGTSYEIGNAYTVIINIGEKMEKTIHLDKSFVTFRVETDSAVEQNLSVSIDRELHQNYIDYVRKKNLGLPQERCDISGEMTYCVSRHRGLLGNAKLVSISNHDETYYGRFEVGEEIIHMGYEVSQAIHLMLKYLLENSQNKRQIGKSCFLINWFSDDIGNEEAINLMNPIAPYGKNDEADSEEQYSEEWEDEKNESDEDDEEDEDDVVQEEKGPKTLGGSISSAINDYITGKNREIDPEGKFYLMILDKISNGRISVKYFRELPKSELYENAEYWYQSTGWFFYDNSAGEIVQKTPALFHYADAIFGMENEKGYLECKNSELKKKTLERLLPCILERRKLPSDMKNRMFQNVCNRSSYDKTWNYVFALGCSVFKKYRIDNQKKGEVSEMLNVNEQTRSYRYGILLAVYEKIEQDVLNKKITDDKDRRATNAERLWSAYTKMPERTLEILERKVNSYREGLIKFNYGLAEHCDNIIMEVTTLIREAKDYEKEKNRPLDEDFVFGYYAQKKELYFYTKKEKKQGNTDANQDEGGRN